MVRDSNFMIDAQDAGKMPVFARMMHCRCNVALPVVSRANRSAHRQQATKPISNVDHVSHKQTYNVQRPMVRLANKNNNSLRCFTTAVRCYQPMPANDQQPDDIWITKEYIQSLPIRQWDGPIQLLHTKDEMESAIHDIIGGVQQQNNVGALGFDIEIKPTFRKGQSLEPPALLQIATADTVYLFRLCALRWYDSFDDDDRTSRHQHRNNNSRIIPTDDDQATTYAFLLPLLTDARIIKSGVNVAFDISNLQRLLPLSFAPAGFYDLVDHCPPAIRNPNLQALAAHYLQCHVPKSKSVNLSNWARKTLTDSQVKYAANDAWLGRAIWQAIQELQQQKG
jgi:ribonuclease D